jgi:hypothetical protein
MSENLFDLLALHKIQGFLSEARYSGALGSGYHILWEEIKGSVLKDLEEIFDRLDEQESQLLDLEELEEQNEKLTQAIKSHCQCRFDPLKNGEQYEECHLHQCQRSMRLDNGDPSEITLEQRIQELEEEVRTLREINLGLAERVVKQTDQLSINAQRGVSYRKVLEEIFGQMDAWMRYEESNPDNTLQHIYYLVKEKLEL